MQRYEKCCAGFFRVTHKPKSGGFCQNVPAKVSTPRISIIGY